MPAKTIRSTRRSTRRTKKRTKKHNKKNRYGGAPAISSKKSSAKSSEKREKLMELIKEKYKKAENIGLTNSTIDIYEYVSENPNILKDKKIQGMLIVLLEQDSDDVEEQINPNEEQLSNDYVNARMRLERLIAAKRNA
jgi:hypothetical protein